MSDTDDFLIFLTSYHKGYKLMRARMGGYTGPPEFLFREKRKEKGMKDSTFRITLYRLRKQGLVERDDLWWHITKKGEEYLQKKIAKLLPLHSKFDSAIVSKSKNMIIIFDIPEKLRKKRHWLREELTRLGFHMMQKSVWFGPSPLPKSFAKNIQDMHLNQFLRFFRANETDIV